MLGIHIRKYFPKGPANPKGAWYPGKVDNFKMDEGGVVWYHVTYEDGDHEYMTEECLKKTFVGRPVTKMEDDDDDHAAEDVAMRGKITESVPADFEQYGEDDVDLWRVQYKNGVQKDYPLEMVLEMLDD